MDLTIESAVAVADAHIERINADSEPPIVGHTEDFQRVGSLTGDAE